MCRYSEASKAIEMISLQFRPDEAISFIDNMTSPIDRMVARVYLCLFYLSYGMTNKFLRNLKILEEENKSHDDPYVNFHLNSMSYFYHLGWHSPRDHIDEVEHYYSLLGKCYESFEFWNTAEEHLIHAVFHFAKSTRGDNPRIAYFLRDFDVFEKGMSYLDIDASGTSYANEFKIWKLYFTLFRGRMRFSRSELNLALDDFQLAEEQGLKLDEDHEGRFLYLVEIYGSLGYWHYFQGNLDQAITFARTAYDIASSHPTVPSYIYSPMENLGLFHLEQGNLEESLQAIQDSIGIRRMYAKDIAPFHLFMGYYILFHYYYSLFEQSGDISYLEDAEAVFEELRAMQQEYPDDFGISNYTKFSQALLLKNGSLRKKARAMELLEELVKAMSVSPANNLARRAQMTLIDLLFEDILLTNDTGSLEQIEELFNSIEQHQLSKNPILLVNYVSFQILHAKYLFYLKSDIKGAIEVLEKLLDLIKPTQLTHQLTLIEHELSKLQQEVSKWESVDLTVRDRIKQSHFKDYIKKAKVMMKEP